MSKNPLFDAVIAELRDLDFEAMFDQVIDELVSLHDSKNADYGADTDPFKNFRGAEEFGVPAWLGAEIRIGDKTRRVEEFCKKGRLNNEGVRDSLIDRACYNIIEVALFDQAAVAAEDEV
jgi:hypothetical protein